MADGYFVLLSLKNCWIFIGCKRKVQGKQGFRLFFSFKETVWKLWLALTAIVCALILHWNAGLRQVWLSCVFVQMVTFSLMVEICWWRLLLHNIQFFFFFKFLTSILVVKNMLSYLQALWSCGCPTAAPLYAIMESNSIQISAQVSQKPLGGEKGTLRSSWLFIHTPNKDILQIGTTQTIDDSVGQG